jgi:hypothetical protein
MGWGEPHSPRRESTLAKRLTLVEKRVALQDQRIDLIVSHVTRLLDLAPTNAQAFAHIYQLLEKLMSTDAEIQSDLDVLADQIAENSTEFSAAIADLKAQISELPGAENVDTSRIDAAVAAQKALADSLAPAPEPAPTDTDTPAPSDPSTTPADTDTTPPADTPADTSTVDPNTGDPSIAQG